MSVTRGATRDQRVQPFGTLVEATAEPVSRDPHLLSRRGFLGASVGVAALGLAGCAKPAPAPAPPAPTTASLLSQQPFFVAHRGGGGDWPEMTGFAYEQASRLPGLQALEISVCRSADGVLVCSHDPTTKRVCGVDYTILDQTWRTLSSLMVTAAGTTNPSQPSQPLTRFDDVVGRYIGQYVLFVEPKTNESIEPLLLKMTSFSAPERVVWKQSVNADFTEAKKRGFTTWGYLLEPRKLSTDRLRQLIESPSVDMIGVQKTEPEQMVKTIVGMATAAGKPTIMWPLASVFERDRAIRLGCQGLMTSNIVELLI